MFKLLGKLVGAEELRSLTVVYVISSALQGITLTLMIPFLRAFLGQEPSVMIWLVAVIVLGVTSMALSTYAMWRSYRISVYDMCDSLIGRIGDKVFRLPLGWFTASREGVVASVTSREINTMSHLASMVIPALCDSFVVPGVMMLAVLVVDWRLGLIMAVTVVPLRVIWQLMDRTATKANVVESGAAAGAAGRIIEYARLQPVLRATRATVSGWQPLDTELAAEDRATRASLALKGRPAGYFMITLQVAFALVLAVGLSSMMHTQLDPVAYLAIMVVTARMLLPLFQSVLYATEVNNGVVALQTVDSIISAEELPEPMTGRREIDSTTIEFDDVTFGYDPGRPVLTGISAVARENCVTAVIGPSGSGKSTILRLAARFWDVDSGRVLIGGIDVRDIPTEQLMQMISMVFQEVYLFDTTILENVRMARPDATDEELFEAARRARLDVVVERLPDGWQTVVGPGGLKLSGGERQRVAIARAFIKDAPILLLDEITSALDGENEAAITEVMKELARGRTVIVVAHRLTTIADADQIVVLAAGEDGAPSGVAEIGSPKCLLAAGGRYADFVAASSTSGRWRLGSEG